MIGNHIQRFIFQITCASDFSGFADQTAENIDIIIGVNMLQHCRNPLQAHTGIHRRFRQWQHRAVSLTVKLHEHHIPDFNVTITVFFGRPWRSAPNVFAVIIKNLGARPARSSVTHLPEIIGSISRTFVITNPHDSLRRYTDGFIPDIIGFLVGFIHRHPQFFFRQIQPLCRS